MKEKMNVEKKLKIAVIGGGNVGSALSVALISSGYDVELVARRIRGVKIDNTISIQICGDFGDKTYLVPVVENIEKLSSKKDIIIICTKSYDAIPILPDIQKWLKKDGTLLTIQNTYWIDSLKTAQISDHCVCMYLDISFAISNNVTYVLNSGGITLGIYDRAAFDNMNLIKEIFDDICEVKETNDLYGFLLGRNILNNAISALGAISGLRLGDILNDRNGRYLFVKMICESVNLFNALNMNILPYNEKLDYYLFTEKGFRAKIYRLKIMHLLKINNRNIRSSALVEIERGRKTEITVPMSSLITLGEERFVAMPYITAIRDMLVEIENGHRRVDKDAFYDEKLLNIKENIK